MRLCTVSKTHIEVSLLLLPVVAGAAVLSLFDVLLTAFFSLTVHEMCHTLVAQSLGYHVQSIQIQPFGGVARMESRMASPSSELLIAAAGPLSSLLMATAAAAVINFAPELTDALKYFVSQNMILAVLNLMPALPLDGGRMLRALLCRAMRARLATKITAGLGILLATLLLGLGVLMTLRDATNISVYIMGVFLLLAAIKELRTLKGAQVNAMLRRTDALRRGEPLRTRGLAVYRDISCGDAFKLLSSNVFNVLTVVDTNMCALGQIDEGRLARGIAEYGTLISVGELLKRMRD